MAKVRGSKAKRSQSNRSGDKSQSRPSKHRKPKDERGEGPNIAIIGGGTRCQDLLEMFVHDRFKHLKAKIVAVADTNPEAPGFLFAKEQGIYTTTDYRDFFQLKNVDLVIELTGKEDLLADILQYKTPDMQVCDHAISRLISDMVTFKGEYKARERDLDFSQSMITTLFAGMREPLFLLRQDYRILDANEPMLSLLGLPKKEVVGRTCHEVSHRSLQPCNSKSCHCPMKETLKTGLSAHAIHEHLDRQNKPRYLEIFTYPLKNNYGQVNMVFEFYRDITDDLESRLERKAREVKKDLAKLVHEDKMIALGKLVASSVHEINNPIAGIHTLAKLMLRTLEEDQLKAEELEEFRRYLELIAHESSRCGQIVSNLLSFARQKELERRRVNINDIIRSVFLLCRHRMELQNIAFHEKLDPDLPQITGDYNQIQQCIMNVIFNAIEAMPAGGKLTIRTSLEKKKRMAQIKIIDTGCGIPEENLSIIFEPFFSTKEEGKGVGLGLSVVYGIIREHQGTIFVNSEVGAGSTFTIRFPTANKGS
ncbi:MAG: PAS domain-containing protein [Deltaproteobacteria bacterium]|nr:PAS domain-containing protein [Deltaproteobacteria bacterium]